MAVINGMPEWWLIASYLVVFFWGYKIGALR